jgi:excisionase family DNA binding protein
MIGEQRFALVKVAEVGRRSEAEVPTQKLAYSVQEAGELVGLSRRMLYELMRTGELGSVKVGKRRLIRHADLERFLAQLDEVGYE